MGFFDVMWEAPVPFGEAYPPFTRISIETVGGCTRSCWFCPVSPRGYMTDELYAKIVGELTGFAGVVQWFFCNEPLQDKKRHERIAMLRAAAPKCCIHLTTNWDVMWRKPEAEQLAEIEQLFSSGVNSLNLNDYEARGYAKIVQAAGVEVVDHCWKRLSPRKRVISCGPLPTELHNWSGAVEGNATGKGHCARPHRHIVVCWDGRVPLCCATNPNTMEVMGDINVQTLEEVWQSHGMFRYRALLQDARREGQCASCNERMAFPHVVRRVTVS